MVSAGDVYRHARLGIVVAVIVSMNIDDHFGRATPPEFWIIRRAVLGCTRSVISFDEVAEKREAPREILRQCVLPEMTSHAHPMQTYD